VARVAANLDVSPPRRVWLTHEPEVTVLAGRRRYQVMIGLPVLAVLEEHEIRGLLAHQLAQLAFPRPDLVIPLADRWRDVATARSDDDASPDDRGTELALRNTGLAVESAADAAAVAGAGSREAAALALTVIDDFFMTLLDFQHSLDLPTRSPRSLARPALEDIDDVWRRAVCGGWSAWEWYEEDLVEVAHRHPDLADAILAIREADVTLHTPRSPLSVRRLNRRARRRLARRWLHMSVLTPATWRTLETAPQDWWAARARHSTKRLRSEIRPVLGRDPVDHVELAEVTLIRIADVVAAYLPEGEVAGDSEAQAGPNPDDHEPLRPPPILMDVLEDALMSRGWRLEHPMVRGVLIGPQGQRVDGRAFTVETYVDNLRTLLTEAHRVHQP
jgi:hypothetical protein